MNIEALKAERAEVNHKLTMKFIAGRRPSDSEMFEVESLRDRLCELDYEIRRDISHCKS